MNNKEAIVVVVMGEKWKKIYNDLFRESHERFAKKLNVPLIIIDDYIDKSQRAISRSPSWQRLLMFSHPQIKEYDRICCIDADIYIKKNAKNPFLATELGTWGVVRNNPYNFPEEEIHNLDLYKYCPEKNRPDYVPNTGFFVVEKKIHDPVFRYIYDNYEEQTCCENGPLSYHMITEQKVTDLNHHFNSQIANNVRHYGVFFWAFVIHKEGFIHFAGGIDEKLVAFVKDIDEHPLMGTLRTVYAKTKARLF